MRKATPITILILLTLLVSSSVTHAQGWFNTNWDYRKAITINASQVDATLTNFPVLIDTTDTDLAADARSDGFDILFTGDNGTAKLDHEIEYLRFRCSCRLGEGTQPFFIRRHSNLPLLWQRRCH